MKNISRISVLLIAFAITGTAANAQLSSEKPSFTPEQIKNLRKPKPVSETNVNNAPLVSQQPASAAPATRPIQETGSKGLPEIPAKTGSTASSVVDSPADSKTAVKSPTTPVTDKRPEKTVSAVKTPSKQQ